jgi:hypothetical protein
MQIEFEKKTAKGCVGGDCPARYKVIGAPGGTVYVGKKLDADTRAQIGDIADDEDALWIPDDL